MTYTKIHQCSTFKTIKKRTSNVAEREKKYVFYSNYFLRLWADSSAEAWHARREGNDTVTVLKNESCRLRTILSSLSHIIIHTWWKSDNLPRSVRANGAYPARSAPMLKVLYMKRKTNGTQSLELSSKQERRIRNINKNLETQSKTPKGRKKSTESIQSNDDEPTPAKRKRLF